MLLINFGDIDGCPSKSKTWLDTDSDSIPDDIDQCPTLRELGFDDIPGLMSEYNELEDTYFGRKLGLSRSSSSKLQETAESEEKLPGGVDAKGAHFK